MNIDEETAKKIQELQILEQNLQATLMQKQTIQVEASEVSNALNDLKKSDDEVYKIIGGIMLKSDKGALTKELDEKKKILSLRISSIEKQEKIFEEKAEKLRKEVTETLSKKKD
jgi:prefoldin beta subunit